MNWFLAFVASLLVLAFSKIVHSAVVLEVSGPRMSQRSGCETAGYVGESVGRLAEGAVFEREEERKKRGRGCQPRGRGGGRGGSRGGMRSSSASRSVASA
jgi:hypothetical protein